MAEITITSPRKKEGRGKLLTSILAFHSFAALLLLLIFIKNNPLLDIKNLSIAVNSIGYAIVLLLLLTPFALWKWKKIGIYGLVLLFIVWTAEYCLYELPVDTRYAYQTNTPVFVVISQSIWFYLAFSFLYFWALKRKWHLFS